LVRKIEATELIVTQAPNKAKLCPCSNSGTPFSRRATRRRPDTIHRNMATTAQAPEPPKDPQSEAIKAQIFQRLHPRSYLERYISEDVRPDGRGFEDWREVSVNVGSISTAHGSALVRMGDTRIVCGVKAEIAEPELDKPHEGFLVPNLDLPALCSPKFKPGPPAEEAQILSERLNEALVA